MVLRAGKDARAEGENGATWQKQVEGERERGSGGRLDEAGGQRAGQMGYVGG